MWTLLQTSLWCVKLANLYVQFMWAVNPVCLTLRYTTPNDFVVGVLKPCSETHVAVNEVREESRSILDQKYQYLRDPIFCTILFQTHSVYLPDWLWCSGGTICCVHDWPLGVLLLYRPGRVAVTNPCPKNVTHR